ncbi:hypothetical protein FPN187_contig00025-0008 [Flavobacterium psychrophilum]|nr:DUF4266 domain-containing protein [Flavobacterium psychrophilum]SNB17505.1 conserved hypothetical protein [Flavobacterium psychrophilum]SNB96892.1 conserved hypothetical protein [Flavobacterium psychrophilum]GAQ48832.1 hypothetical protein FPK15_contig00019-0008 [Flavobacterium psychrophilum]GAW89390.1 hypothetical protein FPS14_contig00020-0050 [Flavobacterium psychrophilum]
MFKQIKIILGMLILITTCSRCTPVKAYQRQYVSDYSMQTGTTSIEKLESEGFSFREGASGGETGKTGGGCGCN